MKKYLFVLLVTVLCTTQLFAQNKATVVGKIENGKPVLTADAATLIKAYSANLLKLGGIDAKFSTVTIQPTDAEGMHQLVFMGDKHKSTFAVMVDGTVLKAISTTSCTTSDCIGENMGGVVKYDAATDIAACTPCANMGKCVKTTSATSMLE
jgi:hypothetical protein